MNPTIADPSPAVSQLTRSQRLKSATQATHALLDRRIMRADIFGSREQFARFLRVQYRFHRDVDVLYSDARLAQRLPGLSERARMLQIAADLRDLGHALPAPAAPRLQGDTPLPTALGWLYVAEGSNLGGAVLFKLAQDKLGLRREFGARHLAAHPDGAARHWREFTAALDAVSLSPAQEEQASSGAEEAFRTVLGYVEEELPLADVRTTEAAAL